MSSSDYSPRKQKKSRIIIRPRRVRDLSLNRLIPNMMTMLGLFAGLTGIRFALMGLFTHAVVALLIAACIDGLDGRIARLLHGTSRFGAEFDSLSDFLCFGVAPCFIIYQWSMQSVGRYGFLPCAFFSICMALRLARFNASLDDSYNAPKYASNFFTGVPAPMGAGLALFPVVLGLEGKRLDINFLSDFAHNPILSTICLMGTALLLVSTIPVWSFKNFKIPTRYVLPVMLSTGVFAALIVAEPWGSMLVVEVIYLSILPLSRRNYQNLKRGAESFKEDTSHNQTSPKSGSDTETLKRKM